MKNLTLFLFILALPFIAIANEIVKLFDKEYRKKSKELKLTKEQILEMFIENEKINQWNRELKKS